MRSRDLTPFALATTLALPAVAQPAPPPAPTPAATPAKTPAPAVTPAPEPPGDLQSPEQASLRYSAYTLPRGRFAFNLGVFGVDGGEAVATLGAAYGIGWGLQVDVNLAHMSVGLLNVVASWHFIDTRYFDLAARVGFTYGHGKWFWIARDPTQELVSKIDVLSVPMTLTASFPVARFLQLDLNAAYTYGQIYGTLASDSNLFLDAQLGVRQLAVRPGARFFITDRTALELFANLPISTVIPLDRADDRTLPFKDAWSAEGGVRSRFAEGLFGSIRLHYGAVANVLYGSRLYPALALELRR